MKITVKFLVNCNQIGNTKQGEGYFGLNITILWFKPCESMWLYFFIPYFTRKCLAIRPGLCQINLYWNKHINELFARPLALLIWPVVICLSTALRFVALSSFIKNVSFCAMAYYTILISIYYVPFSSIIYLNFFIDIFYT